MKKYPCDYCGCAATVSVVICEVCETNNAFYCVCDECKEEYFDDALVKCNGCGEKWAKIVMEMGF